MPAPRAISRRDAGTSDLLVDDVGADLANRGILIAGAAAATHRTDQLAVFDQRKSAGACAQAWIERAGIGVTGFISVVEQPGFTTEARRGAGLALRDRAGGNLCAFHPREMDQLAVGVDDGDIHFPIAPL